MDHSQSSDVFTGSGEYSCESPVAKMDVTAPYELLLLKTKVFLSKNIQIEVESPRFLVHFTDVLEDCSSCVSQSLELIISVLSDSDVHTEKLHNYIRDAVTVIQLLSNIVKIVIETVSMSCCNLKTFPTTTGRIILNVFSHCKDSETIYGIHLKTVEKELKDLFRTCHDLQLTYLLVLEKHFIFDLAEIQELKILVQALEINLEIGEIVQSLDIKTMAEQWKAYTMICEKYSNSLNDKHIFEDCLKILCAMIENNLKSAVEINQEEKITTRSLKVSSFTIKILMKVCNIFKNATLRNYERLIDLLIYVYLNSESYLQVKDEKPEHFINQLTAAILTPVEVVIKELILDEKFVNCLLKVRIEDLKKEDTFLGYILLMIAFIKFVVEKNGEVKIHRHQLIEHVFRFLPYGHIWFNIGLKFKHNANHTHGLYEHLLIHTLALSCTLNNQEINYMEQIMYEAILNVDCYSAMFASNLWSLLARFSPQQYTFTQLLFFCKAYQRLENNKQFSNSPQEVHLRSTISQLFEALGEDDKSRMYRLFNIRDVTNISIWSCLKIKNLPVDVQHDAEDLVIRNMKASFREIFASGTGCGKDVNHLKNLLKAASTCSLVKKADVIEEFVTNAWVKACPVNNHFVLPKGDMDKGAVWYLEYLEALIELTASIGDQFQRSCNIKKILHVALKMIEKGNAEIKLVLLNLFTIPRFNKEPTLEQISSILYQDPDSTVRNKFLNHMLNPHRKNRVEFIERVRNVRRPQKLSTEELKNQLTSATDYIYYHKCIENRVIELIDSRSSSLRKSGSNNFDFADIDTLFEVESDSEPVCKKMKLNTDVEEVICRLEKDVMLLCNLKENLNEYKSRINDLSVKLKKFLSE